MAAGAGNPRLRSAARFLAVAFPAFLFSATALLLVENFTYTLFGINSISFPGMLRFAYAAGLVVLFAFLARRLHRWVGGWRKHPLRRSRWAIYILFIPAGLWVAVEQAPVENGPGPAAPAKEAPLTSNKPLPNILIFGGDGLNADRLPFFGYPRSTMPFLTEWMGRDAGVEEPRQVEVA